jgi:hypothetical protein
MTATSQPRRVRGVRREAERAPPETARGPRIGLAGTGALVTRTLHVLLGKLRLSLGFY